MSIRCNTNEITKTFTLHFDKPVYAEHPNFSNQEMAFTEATATLSAEWDPKTEQWKPKKTSDGKTPRIELHVPKAKRVDHYGELQKADAFHIGGKFRPVPIPLSSVVKKAWNDYTQEEIRTTLLDGFWKSIITS